jgi:hypothetical protein
MVPNWCCAGGISEKTRNIDAKTSTSATSLLALLLPATFLELLASSRGRQPVRLRGAGAAVWRRPPVEHRHARVVQDEVSVGGQAGSKHKEDLKSASIFMVGNTGSVTDSFAVGKPKRTTTNLFSTLHLKN